MKTTNWDEKDWKEWQEYWAKQEPWKREKMLYGCAIAQDYSIREWLTDPDDIKYFEGCYNEIKKNEEEGKHYIYDMPFDFD